MAACSSIAITGAGGFFGWHLLCRLHALSPGADVRAVDRTDFDDDVTLGSALDGVEAVVHLAGANRGSDDDVYDTNVGLAHRLVAALDDAGGRPRVVYANTVQSGRETPYGRSKSEAGEILARWGRFSGGLVSDLRFPNLFGECGRPNYNSAVATFCYDLARGQSSDVNPDGHIELFHVQDACAAVLDAIASPSSRGQRIVGESLSIPNVYGRLRRLGEAYLSTQLPVLSDRLDLRLFNALRTAMFPDSYPMPLEVHRDWRGSFFELVRGHGETQTSFSTTGPGVTRGDHFHLDKIERFVAVSGSGLIRVRRLFSDRVVEYQVSGDSPVAVDMPPLHAHSITNVGDDDLLTVFWANDHFDPAAPDTYPEPVVASVAGVAG